MHISRRRGWDTGLTNMEYYPVQDKVEAILKARSPENEQELQAFLGLLNYYERLICNLSAVLAPLLNLLTLS